ncbi:TIGR02234 family membrane protein [Corynebacterium sp. H128]|uniref:TIGR02234 family membrane protein n=1 Tax=unclassified Corynebacterium TaxID=2624378 RepID=UPI0030A5918C
MRKLATLLLALGAAVVWASSRLTWLSVAAFDDKSGEAVHNLPGAVWSTEMTAVALVLVAAVVATLVLRRIARRIVAAIAGLAAIGASWHPLQLLTTEPDPQRVKDLLTSGAASQQQNKPIIITDWAELTNIQVQHLGPALALLGCALALVAAVLLVMKPGEDGVRRNAYETKRAREERLEADLAEDPDSPRLMWDALDADVDPTTARHDF